MTQAGAEPGALVPFPRGRVLRELPAAERPRERLELRGPSGLSSAELVGLLWGSGSRGRSAVDLAEDAIARFEGLTGLARASGLELEAIPGVGGAKAAQLHEQAKRLGAEVEAKLATPEAEGDWSRVMKLLEIAMDILL